MRTHSSQGFPFAACEYAVVMLAICALLLIPLSGCEFTFNTEDSPTLGEAFSDVGAASENAWGDFEDWWDDTF